MNDLNPDENSSAAPVWVTVLAVILVPVALLFGGLAPMATDSCGPDNCSLALDQTLGVVSGALFATFTATPALLLASWLIPGRRRFATARRAVGWCALLPPLTVILLVLGLPQ
ncbi:MULTISPECIES: hypothetical protein [unclassified Streptomyces]|uniref:hypothetical protein n=1 Tax=unclassified Streptomyces TaxID=2593676 RepID=UPI001BE4F4B6|nr:MULTISPECIES: hypothetical protein [unclassified Streptomyces]MBT2406575.1 hypothetical protein [Streptomyces sp. ISL-21]MBT2608913.1 hypothetical protein [Streptomyces sp. ISL-87]